MGIDFADIKTPYQRTFEHGKCYEFPGILQGRKLRGKDGVPDTRLVPLRLAFHKDHGFTGTTFMGDPWPIQETEFIFGLLVVNECHEVEDLHNFTA